jgi:hypothetical protein
MGMVKAVPYCRETSMGISLVSLQDDKESGERECPFAGGKFLLGSKGKDISMSRQCSACGQVEALMMFEATSCRHGHTWMADKRSEVLAPHELEAHHLSDHLFPACDGSCYKNVKEKE